MGQAYRKDTRHERAAFGEFQVCLISQAHSSQHILCIPLAKTRVSNGRYDGFRLRIVCSWRAVHNVLEVAIDAKRKRVVAVFVHGHTTCYFHEILLGERGSRGDWSSVVTGRKGTPMFASCIHRDRKHTPKRVCEKEV